MKWLEDPVASIREAATRTLQKIAQEFGPEWAKEHLVPQVGRAHAVWTAGGDRGGWMLPLLSASSC